MSAKCVNIAEIEAILCDEKDYPASKGIKNPADPSWKFFDDDRETDSDILWGRDLALDFEEWVALQNHNEALDSRKECYARHRKDEHGNVHYISDDFEAPTTEDVLAYLERQEARGLCNWIIAWHKRRPQNNDHWRRLVLPLVGKLDDPELGETARIILATLKRELPFAQGPVKNTVFVNPDGSRFQTTGTDYGKARASFIKRHKLDGEFVTADRVQYEGERNSKIVVGTRRSSKHTPSRYYDPNPQWQDTVRKEGYLPNSAAFLVMLDLDNMVMPSGSHRLTVREFEQAIIAGCEVMEDECESTACELETEYLPDARVLMIDTGYGKNHRDPMAFSHEEDHLHGVIRKFAKDADHSFWKDALELLALREQDNTQLAAHFRNTPELIDLLDYVSWADKNLPDEDSPHLPYVLSVLKAEERGGATGYRELVNDYNVVDTSLLTRPAARKPAYHGWSEG